MTAANYSEAGLQKRGEEASCPPQACSSQQEGVCGGQGGGRGGGSTVLCAAFLWEEAIKQ